MARDSRTATRACPVAYARRSWITISAGILNGVYPNETGKSVKDNRSMEGAQFAGVMLPF